MKITKIDRWSGSFCMVFSVFICIESYRIDLGSYQEPGPGFFPFWNGVVFGILSLLLLIETFRISQEESSNPFKKILLNRVVSIVGFMFIYALVLEKIGFVVTTLFFIIATLGFTASSRWYIVAIVAITSSLAMYAVFQLWLHSPLPKGIFGI